MVSLCSESVPSKLKKGRLTLWPFRLSASQSVVVCLGSLYLIPPVTPPSTPNAQSQAPHGQKHKQIGPAAAHPHARPVGGENHDIRRHKDEGKDRAKNPLVVYIAYGSHL